MRLLRPASFCLSLCFHAGIIALIFLVPQGPPPLVDLTAPVIDIGIYTIGKPGAAPSAKTPSAPAAAPATAPASQAAPPKPQAAPETPPPSPVKPAPTPAKPEPAPIPIPQPEAPKPKPEPPKPEPVKPEPEKPVTQAKPEPPKPATPPKAEPAKPASAAKPDTAKPAAQGGQTGPAKPGKSQRSADDILSAALGDLKTQTPDPNGTEGGDGPGGAGGDGIGIVGSYMQSLVSRIRPNWEYQGRADRKNPTAIVRIRISKDGTILDATIEKSSGDTAFDGSVLKAVRDTIRVEPPPTPDLADVLVPFALEAIR